MMPPPPPPYTPAQFPSCSSRNLASLPLPLLLRIISYTLDARATPNKWVTDIDEERVRRVWGLFGMRGVSRSFWLVSTSILRTLYHPTYLDLVQPGYSSDAYPHDSHPSYFEAQGLALPAEAKTVDGSRAKPILTIFELRSRESTVFDRWIAIRVGEELRKVESALSEDSGAEREIFARFQPAARIEDLLKVYVPQTLITHGPSTSPGAPSTALPLPHPHLSITLTPGWCQLYIWAKPYGKTGNGKDLVLEVRRGSTLEGTVRRIGEGLEDMGRGLVEWGGRVL